MRIQPINNQTNFKAVNQKYYQWAKKDINMGVGFSGEVLNQLEMMVFWKMMQAQDAIDTVEAIKKILPRPRADVDDTLEYLKTFLPSSSENK